MQTRDLEGQVSMFGPGLPCGKTCLGVSAARRTASPARTSGRSSNRSSGLKNRPLMLLDLRPGAGNMLGPYWEYDPAWLGRSGRLNTSACPKGGVESSLSQILQASVPSKYYLSRAACRGILRRAEERGKSLPPQLELALKLQAGIIRPPPGVSVSELMQTAMNEQGAAALLIAFAANQRDEVRDLHDLSAALSAQPGMKQQTFIANCLNPWDTQQSRVFTPEGTAPTLASADGGGGRNPGGLVYTAGLSAGAGSSARSLGYQEEMSPTLKAGNNDTSVLCLNDQGGQRMDITVDQVGTLRAQAGGHQPLIFENHSLDARYRGPLPTAPTISAAYRTGGNNTTLALQKCETVFARQRVDNFRESDVVSTESARQHKDATDLVLQPDGPSILLIRRLTPLECELLQGYPPGWTDIPGASDSARYKALGNSVAIPCVEYLMQGIALVLRAEYRIKTSPGT